jgi:hypothetical protein
MDAGRWQVVAADHAVTIFIFYPAGVERIIPGDLKRLSPGSLFPSLKVPEKLAVTSEKVTLQSGCDFSR